MWKIIVDLIPALSVIVSAILSYVVASIKAKNEIKKLKATYNREDVIRYHNAYALVMEKTHAYCLSGNGINQKETINAIATLSAVAPPELDAILIQMDSAVSNNNLRQLPELRKQLETEFLNRKQNT